MIEKVRGSTETDVPCPTNVSSHYALSSRKIKSINQDVRTDTETGRAFEQKKTRILTKLGPNIVSSWFTTAGSGLYI